MDDKFMDIPDADKLNTLSLLKIKIISGKGWTLLGLELNNHNYSQIKKLWVLM